ncbi:MAG: hypothetical protein IPF54_08620 [Draconibacterium sp.]|nr:hypothetical protein [Draconibacterium sp.]
MNKNTEVFVQSNFIKDGFTEHFDISKDRIQVISPKLAVPILNETKYSNQNQDKINLFYPATPFIYKNHSMLFEAISLIDEELQKKITLTLTCTKEEIGHIIKNQSLISILIFLVRFPFQKFWIIINWLMHWCFKLYRNNWVAAFRSCFFRFANHNFKSSVCT